MRERVYWVDDEALAGRAAGLTLVVREQSDARLVLESTRSGRLRLRAGSEPILWARIEEHYEGVWLLRRATTESPAVVRPIRASDARAIDTTPGWLRFFASELAASPRSPLDRGTWHLTEVLGAPEAPPEIPRVRELARAPERSRLEYFRWGVSASNAVFPLRSLEAADAARVKAWRKHARAGTLPPVLVWFVCGAETPLLIDGHDRLRAALAEGVTPRAVVLWQSVERDDREADRWRASVAESYVKAHLREDSLSAQTRRGLNDALVRAFRGSYGAPISVARARPGLDASWCAEVAAELGADSEDARELCSDAA